MAASLEKVTLFHWKVAKYFLNTLGVENLDEIALSHTVKEKANISCFSILGKNLKIQNGRYFWKFFWKVVIYFLNTLGVENFDEITLSRTVKEIAKFFCFSILGENLKFKMVIICENFLKSCHILL